MIVELINRSGSVLDHYQFSGDEIRIGRAYDNDLILHDDYIDGNHLILRIDEACEGFIFEDLSTTNGTEVVVMRGHNSADTKHSHWLASGGTLCLGKSYLRIKLRAHEVPPAQKISFWDNASHTFGSPVVVILSALFLVMINLYAQYFELPSSDNLKQYGIGSSYLIIFALFYAAIWSIIARTQKLDGRFLVQANLCIWFLVADLLYGFINPVLLFNLGVPGQFFIIETLVGCVLMYVLMYASLFLATRAKKYTRNLGAIIIPVLVLLFSLSSLYKASDFHPFPKYDSLIVSPSLNFRGAISEQVFMEDAQELYQPPNDE